MKSVRLRYSVLPVIGVAVVLGWLWLAPGGIKQAPDARFRITDGTTLELASLRGRPVLVTFWATTCSGCRREMPHLIALHTELAPRGFEIIAVAMAYDPPNQVLALQENLRLPYPVALDIDGQIAALFDNVTLTPTSFLVSPDGRIALHQIGETDMQHLRARISAMLPEPVAADGPILPQLAGN